MCQMRVILETKTGPELIMEEVSGLEVQPEGVVLMSLFDEPRMIVGTSVQKIDFMATLVTLSPRGAAHGTVK